MAKAIKKTNTPIAKLIMILSRLSPVAISFFLRVLGTPTLFLFARRIYYKDPQLSRWIRSKVFPSLVEYDSSVSILKSYPIWIILSQIRESSLHYLNRFLQVSATSFSRSE
jgi:hypothetical protein